MRTTKRTVKPTTQFKRDFKQAIKRGLKIQLLEDVIAILAMGEELPERNRDHALTGDWVGHRECHIQPDWLLIYRIEEDVLVLTLSRTGTHSDLFGKYPILTNVSTQGVFEIFPQFADAMNATADYADIQTPYIADFSVTESFESAQGMSSVAISPSILRADFTQDGMAG